MLSSTQSFERQLQQPLPTMDRSIHRDLHRNHHCGPIIRIVVVVIRVVVPIHGDSMNRIFCRHDTGNDHR